MKQYQIVVTRQAREHIAEYAGYIRNELLNPTASETLVQKLYSEISMLDQMPSRYPLTEEESWHTHGIRKLTVAGYIIYYNIDECASLVRVLAVVYGRRNQVEVMTQIDN